MFTRHEETQGNFPRSLVAMIALVAGFAIARYFVSGPASITFSAAALMALAGGFGRHWACRVLLVGAAMMFGHAWYSMRIVEPKATGFEAIQSGAIIRLEGLVLETPRVDEPEVDPLYPHIPEGPRLHLDVRAKALLTDAGERPVRGDVWVRAAGGASDLRAGDVVRITGKLEHIGAPMNPGEPDRRLWAAQDGRIGWVRAPSAELIERVEEGEGLEALWLRSRAWLRDRAHAVLLGRERNEGRAVLGALILGEEDRSLRDIRGAFNRLGLAHVLSISGFHLTVMAGVVLLMLRVWGDLGRLESILTVALILLYLSILPFNAPVWRSGLMVLGLLAGDALGRRYDRVTILGWIAVVLLLYRPMDAWSMGFQLSFGLVALLVKYGELAHGRIFGVPLKGTVRPHRSRPVEVVMWLLESVKRLASTSLLCGLVATPIVAYHTGLVSPSAVISSIVLVPPIAALLITGYIVLLVGIIAPPLSGIASDMLGKLADWCAAMIRWCDAIPGTSLTVPRISLALAIAATGLVLYWFIRGHKRDVTAWVASILVFGWILAEFRLSSHLDRGTQLRIDTLAVGDGTCHIIRSGRDAMLWDCGSLEPGVGRVLVPRAARALGVHRVPTVLVTHPNLDHFNGVLDAAEPLGIRKLVTSVAVAKRAEQSPRSAEAHTFAKLRERGVEIVIVHAGDSLALGDVTLEFISPERDAAWPDDNDWSLVARIVPRGQSRTLALMTGDIETPAIKSIQERYPGLQSMVVEVPHHGSAREGAMSFVSSVKPEVVLQSTGMQRAADARWDGVRSSTTWYCTALDGAAWVEVMSDGSVKSGALRER